MGIDKLISENLSIWYLTHQQFHHNGNSLALKSESFGAVRRFPDRLVQSVQRIGVLSPDGLNSASIVQVLTEFVAGLPLRE